MNFNKTAKEGDMELKQLLLESINEMFINKVVTIQHSRVNVTVKIVKVSFEDGNLRLETDSEVTKYILVALGREKFGIGHSYDYSVLHKVGAGAWSAIALDGQVTVD